MTNKTAIDILIEDLLSGKLLIGVLSNKEKYKDIEKQDISEAYIAGREYGCNHDDPETGEEYYEQTFGNSQNTPS